MKIYSKVFIVVLNYNGRKFIKKCLSSVFKLEYPNFEVVVVDNNSTDGSLEIAKNTFSRANFIKNEENLGFSAGNNVGIRFSLERMADYILILNNDAEVEKDFLAKLVGAGENNVGVGILSPVIFSGLTKEVWFSGGKINWLRMRTEHERDIKKEECYATGYVTGCAMLIKASVFKSIGLFDENFFLYWEDADFSLRAQRAGFGNRLVSSSWVYHFENSEKNNKNKIYWLVFSGLLFFKKNTPLFLRPGIFFCVLFRKIKNRLDLLSGKADQEIAKMVQRAYKDFNKARSSF